jgi:LEA14-like dessication related protein
VTLLNIKPVQIEFIEQRYVATIRIQNPNPVGLPIRGMEYVIRINDSEFANGVSSQHVTVPAYGEKTLDVGVTSTIVKLFEQMRRFGRSDGNVRYGIRGSLGLQGAPAPVPFEHEGEFDLRLEPPTRERAV